MHHCTDVIAGSIIGTSFAILLVNNKNYITMIVFTQCKKLTDQVFYIDVWSEKKDICRKH